MPNARGHRPIVSRAKHDSLRQTASLANPNGTAPTRLLGLALLLCLTLGAGCSATVKTNAADPDDLHSIKPIVKPPVVVAADPEWFGCKTDADCTVQEGVCGVDQAVNKMFTTQFFSYRDEMERSVSCLNEATATIQHTAQCVKQRCSLNPPDQQPQ